MRDRLRTALCCILALAPLTVPADDRLAVVVYPGYGDDRRVLVDGRVIEARRTQPEQSADSRWTNLLRNLRRLVNDERAGVSLTVQVGPHRWPAVTDDEGYFRVDSVAELPAGWHPVQVVTADGTVGEGHMLRVPAQNTLGLISDLDDTILESQVNDKSKLLANSLLRNAHQRKPVAGMAAFYRRLLAANPQPESAAVFYLTASPRQLYAGIDLFLRTNAFPPGVVIGKRPDRDPLTDQVAYKTARIEEIFARLPGVTFVLAGDDGEQDPEVFQEIRDRHPHRVRAVWIRRVHPDSERIRYSGQMDVAGALKEDRRHVSP